MSQKLKLKYFGAAGTVTGSKTVIEYNNQKFLFDCGLFQGPSELRERNWIEYPELKDCRAVVLSHAHVDHTGYLPKLVKDGFRGPIYSTPATEDLCKLLLPDAAYLQEEDAKFANKAGYSRHEPALALYDIQDAEKTLKLFRTIPFHQWHELTEGLSFRYLHAGHILGSAITQFSFQTNEGPKILTITGDLGNGRSFILEDPEKVSQTDYLVMESTYGDRKQANEDTLSILEKIINKIVGQGGTLIIPAFAVGRTQEILYLVNQLENQKRIPVYPIYLDSPMANSATDIYLKYPEELKQELRDGQIASRLSLSEFREVRSADDSMLLCMSTQPKIVISAGGMLTGGRVLHHLKSKLPDEKSGVLFVGYQATGTKGLLLKNGLKDIRIHHQKVTVEAEVFSIDSLSAHADCDDLNKFVENFVEKPKKVILNHGESNALESLRYHLKAEHQLNVEVAEQGKEYILD